MLHFFKGFDWKKSEAHLLLLSRFVRPQCPDDFAKLRHWDRVLGESPEQAVKRFVDEGVLAASSLDVLLSYKYKTNELRDMLKQRSLPSSGRKDEMIHRLIEADPNGMEKTVKELKFLECTQQGRGIALQYLRTEGEKHTKIEQQVMEYLRKRKFKEASLAVAAYEAEQVFPRGMGMDWRHYNPERDVEILSSIFKNKPDILAQLGDDKLEVLRISACMMELWGKNEASEWLPADFETGLSMDNDAAARMLLFQSQHSETLNGYDESGVLYVEILATPDSCESCKKLEGKRYKLKDAPKLPNKYCIHEMGCRCVYIPVIDEND